MKVNECNINVVNNIIQVGGDNSPAGPYEKAIMGDKHEKWRNDLKSKCQDVAEAALRQSDKTGHLVDALNAFAEQFTKNDILCEKCYVN